MISTALRAEVCPLTTRMHSLDTPSASARTLSRAALVLPRSAGAVTRTLSVSPSHPAMQFRDDAGTTLIGNVMVVSPFKKKAGPKGPALRTLDDRRWRFDD